MMEWIRADNPPQSYYPVLVYLPEEAPFPTVHEGFYVESEGYCSLRLGKVEPTM